MSPETVKMDDHRCSTICAPLAKGLGGEESVVSAGRDYYMTRQRKRLGSYPPGGSSPSQSWLAFACGPAAPAGRQRAATERVRTCCTAR